MTVIEGERVTGQQVTARDVDGPVSFRGEVLVDLSWTPTPVDEPSMGAPLLRWTDMLLYRVLEDSPYQYALQIVGRSVVYHRPGGPCRRGVRKTVEKLAENEDRFYTLRPCTKRGCYRGVSVAFLLEKTEEQDQDVLAVETDRYTLHKCEDPQGVIDALRDENGVVSGLGQQLLDAACDEDPTIASTMMTGKKL